MLQVTENMGKNEAEKVCSVDRNHLEERRGANKGWGCRLPVPMPRPSNQTLWSEWGRERTASDWRRQIELDRLAPWPPGWGTVWTTPADVLPGRQSKGVNCNSQRFPACVLGGTNGDAPRKSPHLQVHPPRARLSAWGDLPSIVLGAKRTFFNNKNKGEKPWTRW